MRMSDVPKKAFTAKPTPIPQKLVNDWEALYEVTRKRGFVVIESTDLRMSVIGAEECVPVKNFNNYVRIVKRERLYTKRISENRWVCVL
jgi:hypothetical protein